MQFDTIKAALEYVGGMSKPSKMPCPSYSIPATTCKFGKYLRTQCNSVCSDCYGMKGCYRFPVVKNALETRFSTLEKEGWVDAFIFAITKKKLSFFRWHDVGDLQSVEHFEKIVAVAVACPNCKFWLPTKEIAMVRTWLDKGNKLPENLNVRISAFFVDVFDQSFQSLADGMGCTVATVATDSTRANCFAYQNDGACGDCRKCWNKDIPEVCYPKH